MKRLAIGTVSVLGGWLLATGVVVCLQIVRLDIAAMLASSLSEYRTFTGATILVFTVLLGWALYDVLARRFLGRKRSTTPGRQRLRELVEEPTGWRLVAAWFLAVFTIVLYPVAGYMTWRFYKARRDADSRTCPRCAERIKAAALVCRYCGADLAPAVSGPRDPVLMDRPAEPTVTSSAAGGPAGPFSGVLGFEPATTTSPRPFAASTIGRPADFRRLRTPLVGGLTMVVAAALALGGLIASTPALVILGIWLGAAIAIAGLIAWARRPAIEEA